MNIEWFAHYGVAANGEVASGGAVCVDGDFRQSPPNGGCGLPGCNCSEGQWISKIYPRTADGVVAGFVAHFDNRKEFENLSFELIEQAAMRLRT